MTRALRERDDQRPACSTGEAGGAQTLQAFAEGLEMCLTAYSSHRGWLFSRTVTLLAMLAVVLRSCWLDTALRWLPVL